jgi:hypothetical protein
LGADYRSREEAETALGAAVRGFISGLREDGFL